MYFGIDRIRFSDGRAYIPPLPGITLIVGPNNSGKSQLLREIADAGNPSFLSARFYEMSVACSAADDELLSWFEVITRPGKAVDDLGRTLRRFGDPLSGEAQQASPSDMLNIWLNLPGRVDPNAQLYAGGLDGYMRRNLVRMLGAADRLGAAASQTTRDLNTAPTHPLHYLWDDTGREQAFSDHINAVFGIPLSVNRVALANLRLLIGHPVGVMTLPVDPDIFEEFERRLPISDTSVGDGIRSYIGTLLNASFGKHKLLLIDEPEAFLHPPQARQLGRALVQWVDPDMQVFIATHSADFLEGIVGAAGESHTVNILRLSELDGLRKGVALAPEDVRVLWQDPLFKVANAVDSFFYPATVICEGSSDARFYQATVEAMSLAPATADSIHWINMSGKARVAKMLATLRGFGIATACILDFDILRTEDLFADVLAAAGFADVQRAAAVVKTLNVELMSRGTASTVGALRTQMRETLQRTDSSSLDDRERAVLRELAKANPGWEEAKAHGLSALKACGADVHALLDELHEFGIFIVPVGELESWYPASGGKSGWVLRAIESGLHTTPNEALSRFLNAVVNWAAPGGRP